MWALLRASSAFILPQQKEKRNTLHTHKYPSAVWVTVKLGVVDLLTSVGKASTVELAEASEHGISIVLTNKSFYIQ